jgi:hypothetical protein
MFTRPYKLKFLDFIVGLFTVDLGGEVHDFGEHELGRLILGAIQFVLSTVAILVGVCTPKWLLFKFRNEVRVVVSGALA